MPEKPTPPPLESTTTPDKPENIVLVMLAKTDEHLKTARFCIKFSAVAVILSFIFVIVLKAMDPKTPVDGKVLLTCIGSATALLASIKLLQGFVVDMTKLAIAYEKKRP